MKTMQINKFSIKTKLIMLLGFTTILAIIIATASSLIYYYFDSKDRVVDDTIQLAKVSGKNIAASLMFYDKDSIHTILEPILLDKDVKSIKVFDINGNLFTSIGKENIANTAFTSSKLEPQALISKKLRVIMDIDNIIVITTINHANEDIGFLELNIAYKLNKYFTIAIGAENLFDVYPDRWGNTGVPYPLCFIFIRNRMKIFTPISYFVVRRVWVRIQIGLMAVIRNSGHPSEQHMLY